MTCNDTELAVFVTRVRAAEKEHLLASQEKDVHSNWNVECTEP